LFSYILKIEKNFGKNELNKFIPLKRGREERRGETHY